MRRRSRGCSPTRRSSSGLAAPRRGGCLLHEDAELGFQVLAHINEKPRISPPHNHGESWAIYGQATGYTDMTEFRRVDDGSDPAQAEARDDPESTASTPGGRRLPEHHDPLDRLPGEIALHPITGTNLDRIYRDAFDPATGAIKRMGPQRAT